MALGALAPAAARVERVSALLSRLLSLFMVEFGPGVAVWFVTGLLGEVSFRSGSILGALASAAARAERFLALLGRPFI
jgi:hypothetical protein